jgi:hypothetical protein
MDLMMATFEGVGPEGFPIVRQYDDATGLGDLISKSRKPMLMKVRRPPRHPEEKPTAQRYGRIHNMMQGDVSGQQTIVCKDAGGIREVCVFNAEGGAWSDLMEAELQTVMKALQRAA